jgi:TPR repeat protein
MGCQLGGELRYRAAPPTRLPGYFQHAGFLVPQDERGAIELYWIAAIFRYSGAARLLAWFYQTGRCGLAIDTKRSAAYWRASSRLSQRHLARMAALQTPAAVVVSFGSQVR